MVGDDGLLGVDLQDEAAGTIGVGATHGVLDRRCEHVVEQSGDLEDLDEPSGLHRRVHLIALVLLLVLLVDLIVLRARRRGQHAEEHDHCAHSSKEADHYSRHRMDPSDFFTASRVLIVAGKGGVGKTTVSAALGVAASRAGIDTLLVEIEGKRGLATVFESTDRDTARLEYDDTELIPEDQARGVARLRARTIRADAALMDYLEEHGLRGFARTLTRLQVLDTLATSTPGLRDLIVLGKIKQLEVTRDARLIIVDAPASGHAIGFLRAAAGLQRTIETGPIRRQADEVVALLTDPTRAQVLLVTLAEETPVNELVETAYAVEDDVGVHLGPAIVNSLFPTTDASPVVSRTSKIDPALATAAAHAVEHWRARADAQADQCGRLADELPLEQLRLPRCFTTRIGPGDLDRLADAVTDQLRSLRFGVAS